MGRRYKRCLSILHGFTKKVIRDRSALRESQKGQPTTTSTEDDLGKCTVQVQGYNPPRLGPPAEHVCTRRCLPRRRSRPLSLNLASAVWSGCGQIVALACQFHSGLSSRPRKRLPSKLNYGRSFAAQHF